MAIKVLPPGPEQEAMPLAREVSILASLRHPGVVRLLDAGVVPQSLPGIPAGSTWLAMEKVAGQDLARSGLDAGSRSILMVLYQLLDTLAYIHSRGYVHGDLSPANVLWSVRDWRVKVVDFGVAREVGALRDHAVGTPGYLAPERRAGAPLSPATDLFSLGRLGLQLLQQNHRGMAALNGVPVDRLALWLQQLAAEDPAARPPRAAEARALLAQMVGPRPKLLLGPATPSPTPSGEPPGALTATVPATAGPPNAAAPAGPRIASPVRPPSTVPTAPIEPPTSFPAPSPSLELGWMAIGAAVFAARGSTLIGRDPLRERLWSDLCAASERAIVLRLEGPRGVGVSRILDELAHAADETGTAHVLREPRPATTNRHTVLWVFDEPFPEAVEFARHPPARGLIVLGRGPEVGTTVSLAPLPLPLRAALVRSMLPVDADVAGWIAGRAGGLPGATRAHLLTLMQESRLELAGRRYAWAPGQRPPPGPIHPTELLDRAHREFAEAANEQAWSRACDLRATGTLAAGRPLYARWLDLVGMLADRLPRDVPPELLAEPLSADGSAPTADALYQRGVRALRREQYDHAQQHFLDYLERATDPQTRALGTWQLGAVAFGRGQLPEAREHFTAAHDLLADGSDPARFAHTLLALSLVDSNLGHFRSALDWADRASAAFERIGKPRHRANIADFESSCFLWLGELELAEARARESLARYADDGSPNRLFPLLNLAAALHHQGRRALVRDILDEVARRAGTEAPALLGVVALYGALFAAQEAQGDLWDQHWEAFEEVWATGARWHPATSRMLYDIGLLLLERGWSDRLDRLRPRLRSLKEQLGEAVLRRFGVDAHPSGSDSGIF